MLGMLDNVHLKLTAVALAEFAVGVEDITILSLTSYFKPSALSWYSTGSGFGYVIGALYYTALTTWLRLSPSITLLTLAPLSLIYLLCYYFIQEEITKGEPRLVSKNGAVYTMLENFDENEDENCSRQKNQDSFARNNLLSFKCKLLAAKKMILIFGIPIFLLSFSDMTLYGSIVTTISYPYSPFPPRDHYQYYYSLTMMMGEVLGRSHRSILEMVKPDWLLTPSTFRLWLLAAIEGLILTFLFLESWFRFLPDIGTVIFLCFCDGLINGFAFIIGIELVRMTFEDKEREFAMSITPVAGIFGDLIGALIGLYIEPQLRRHCSLSVANPDHCFTRHKQLS
ncbi:Battenin [Exaiptasia diaphana]|nr:Battenin [Exaiptasia diaphana]